MQTESIILASGCFWCTEAIFSRLEGVKSVTPGYIGGNLDNPTYEQVCTGTTNHAEALKVEFNPNEISLQELFAVFFTTHDPTSLNRQGNDIGTQYRSEIFYTNDKQKQVAEEVLEGLQKGQFFVNPIVTRITEAPTFWKAEDYHRKYFENNPEKSYCQAVIKPKVEKFEGLFMNKIKK